MELTVSYSQELKQALELNETLLLAGKEPIRITLGVGNCTSDAEWIGELVNHGYSIKVIPTGQSYHPYQVIATFEKDSAPTFVWQPKKVSKK